LRAGELSLMMRRDMALELVNENLIAEHARALLPNVRDFERATAQLTWRGGATLSETLASWAEEVARSPGLAAQLIAAIAAQPQDDPHITRARETILTHIGAKGLTLFDAIQAHAP